MLNTKMQELGENRSVIRDLFEYGKKRKKEIGEDKVFDFSLGNPCVPAPDPVNETIYDLLDSQDDVYMHGYTSAQGDLLTRRTIAADLNRRFGTSFQADNLYMTCGAAASLKISLTALIVPDAGDEVLTFAPYFPEYRVFAETAGAVFRFIPTDPETFQIRIPELEKLVGENTKAVIINSPNNPSGVVYPEAVIRELSAVLTAKEKEYGHPIYLIADEPYRELVYDSSTVVPYLPNYYPDTLVCYSYSKSLSLPGERIGYILVPDKAADSKAVYAAVCGAGRALGYVCAPSLMQHVIAACDGMVSDLEAYKENRDLLYQSLVSFGYTCVHPDGAFYLFVKAMEADASAFCERAKKHELLLVPADSFGAPGYVRIAYCVTKTQIRNSLPAFRALAEEYKKG